MKKVNNKDNNSKKNKIGGGKAKGQISKQMLKENTV